jgi:hypothetical protein
MPPRAVWKIRPSGVVPYRLMWARAQAASASRTVAVSSSAATGSEVRSAQQWAAMRS